METSRIKEIIRLVRECGVAELEVKDESGRLYIRMPEQGCDSALCADEDFSDDEVCACDSNCCDDASFGERAEEAVAAEIASADSEPEEGAALASACDEAELEDESESSDAASDEDELADQPEPAEAAVAGTGKLAAGTPSTFSADEEVPEGWVPVISPVVGTFFSSEVAGDDPYAQVGKAVSQGKPLGVVKAMNICNRIKAPETGVVRRILVSDGDTVQYGTVLAYLEPADDLVRATLGEV